GESTAAKTSYERAIVLQVGLTRDYPNVCQFQNDLGRSHFNLGDLLVQLGKGNDARNAYGKAVTVWEELTRSHPAVLDYQTILADALLRLARELAGEQQ